MNLPSPIMRTDGVRLVSSRNQRTGDTTRYIYVATRRPRKFIARICLAVFAVISIGLMGVGAVKGLGL